MLEIIWPILQTGAVGAMMILVWRLMVKKDKKSYEMIEAQNEERKEMYQSQTELVQEVVKALQDKNHTDDKMSKALEKLAEELRSIHKTLKEKDNGTA